MIDRDFEQVSEEHMKSMTKPEGPAQEPHVFELGICQFCGATDSGVFRLQPCVPATPAPAGAREWLEAYDRPLRIRDGLHKQQIVRALELYARQQTAAKDAEIERLRLERDEAKYKTAYRCGCYVCGKQAPAKERHLRLFCEEHKDAHATFQRAEAAERERDSLREALVKIRDQGDEGKYPQLKPWAIADAALKAGKDGQQ